MNPSVPITCFDTPSQEVFSLDGILMGKILSDRQVKSLFGSVIRGADENLVNPNGIELRLGRRVKFISTGDERDIPEGHFLKVGPGETVIISSLEKIDLRRETLEPHFLATQLVFLSRLAVDGDEKE